MNLTHEPSRDQYLRGYLAVHPGIAASLQMPACQILPFETSVIPHLAPIQPKLFAFDLLKKQCFRLQSKISVQFPPAFTLQQHPLFPCRSDPDEFSLLIQSAQNPKLGAILTYPLCKAMLLQGMPHEFCCKSC
jgi:hypothetical protein